MGYTTDFVGRFTVEPRLTMEQFAELSELVEWPGDGKARGGYCQWKPTKDGKGLEWDGGEKFYDYVECLEWIIRTKLKPWGCVLSGSVKYKGEQRDDRGTVEVAANVVTKRETGLFEQGKTPLETAKNALREVVSVAREQGEDRSLEVAQAGLAALETKSKPVADPSPRRSG